jgi:hypothetical protein
LKGINVVKFTKHRTIGGLVLVACLVLTACTHSSSGAQSTGQALTEQAFQQQSSAVPYPADKLNDSLERRNVRERLLRYNNPSKISYIYLLSSTGGIYAYFTVKGKVTSNSSQLTTDQLVYRYCRDSSCSDNVVSAPGDDGSYGPNEPGIFFFTTDNVLVTWDGPYLLTDAPMKVNAATVPLEYVNGSKPSSVGGR